MTDMSQSLVQKLRYRATHRGMKELDYILGNALEMYLSQNHTESDLIALEKILDQEDMELWEKIRYDKDVFTFGKLIRHTASTHGE